MAGGARGHDWGVDIVHPGADIAAVAVLGKSAQHLIARARILNRQHVRIQAINCLQSHAAPKLHPALRWDVSLEPCEAPLKEV